MCGELLGAYAVTFSALAAGAAIWFILVGPLVLVDHKPGDPTSSWAIARPWLILAVTVAVVAPPLMVWSGLSSADGGLGLLQVAVAAVPISVVSFLASKMTADDATFGARDVVIVWTILISSALSWRRRRERRDGSPHPPEEGTDGVRL